MGMWAKVRCRNGIPLRHRTVALMTLGSAYELLLPSPYGQSQRRQGGISCVRILASAV